MLRPLFRWYRALRFGTPIVVVSGLPRSGTSMAMRMLEQGGLAIVADGVRAADDSNPRGYYECERVKGLDRDADKSWLTGARGKGIKIISFLLRDLPDTNNYRVIFMHRDLGEVLVSQNRMLAASGTPADRVDDARLAAGYQSHLDVVQRLLARRPCFDTLDLGYEDVLAQPRAQAERIAAFLEAGLDVPKMAAAVDPALHRSRG